MKTFRYDSRSPFDWYIKTNLYIDSVQLQTSRGLLNVFKPFKYEQKRVEEICSRASQGPSKSEVLFATRFCSAMTWVTMFTEISQYDTFSVLRF